MKTALQGFADQGQNIDIPRHGNADAMQDAAFLVLTSVSEAMGTTFQEGIRRV